MRSNGGRTSPFRVAIVFPADPEQRQKTRLEDSRFARTAAALAERGIAVEGAPYIADDVARLREQRNSSGNNTARGSGDHHSTGCPGEYQGKIPRR